MGLKLEWLVILLIVLTVGITTMVKLTNTIDGQKSNAKELEFYKTTFIEVDRYKMHSKSFVEKGIRVEGVLNLEYLKYSTKNITSLVADKARYYQNILHLDGNIYLKENKGYSYHADNAEYNQKTAVLTVPSKFTADNGINIIHGLSLYYDSLKKEMNATNIDAIIYTTKK
ncbi:MAG: hypothetical protein L3J43_01460 [Sulfurovum sp.]|nr:hypothetical protein [Sulfurovum sp.]